MKILNSKIILNSKSDTPTNFTVGAIRVPLAILWSDTTPKRQYDNSILGLNTDPDAWANGMTTDMRRWLVGKVETNALFGERVVILKSKGDWVNVAAINQRTSKNSIGYPGWVPSVQVSTNPIYLAEQTTLPEVVVIVPMTTLYEDTNFNKAICKLSYQTKLPILSEFDDSFSVRLPEGNIGYLLKSETRKVQDLTFSKENVLTQARQFIGLRYIWGGTSAWGFDCSGFTFRVYQSQKISIPRDAQEQFLEGISIQKEALLPSDLVFFSNAKGQIHHVGINTDNGDMIHSANSSSFVKENAFDTSAKDYYGARRYI